MVDNSKAAVRINVSAHVELYDQAKMSSQSLGSELSQAAAYPLPNSANSMGQQYLKPDQSTHTHTHTDAHSEKAHATRFPKWRAPCCMEVRSRKEAVASLRALRMRTHPNQDKWRKPVVSGEWLPSVHACVASMGARGLAGAQAAAHAARAQADHIFGSLQATSSTKGCRRCCRDPFWAVCCDAGDAGNAGDARGAGKLDRI